MKLVKLSLVAALAAGAFSAANAVSLEEAIKDVDLSGVLRYRYDTGAVDKTDTYGFTDNRSSINKKQDHNFRAQVNFKASIADNFKAFVQLEYNNTDGGYTPTASNNNNTSSTEGTIAVRQLYLEYNNADYATSIIAGKQQLNTIWTDNDIDGLVGTGLKIVNNSIDGLTLAAFVVDSFNAGAGESDTILNSKDGNGNPNAFGFNPYEHNLYGAALIGSYEALGGTINPQLWLSYLNNSAFFYAVDVAYNTTIFGDVNWGLEAAYLGNSVDNELQDEFIGKDGVGNGNFFALKGTLAAYGWDGSLGGVYYGDKDQLTFTTLEDNGNIGHLFAGQELKYTDGSHLSGDFGRNIFGYVTLGYTFNETVRLGGDFVYGGTKTGFTEIDNGGGDKMELVARVDYKYSPKLSFQAWYSYVDVDGNSDATQGQKDTVRLQALYKF
ncbi:major outer membrane protein [Campylobacter sp. US33a]|uniref:major outer membrane protein n=1 Tax=Campylobacter sp. US33a TaxID=2498120 RepID=UPI0010677A1E|nr:major outer membrane protein [Campylobacter sp. US33a]TEY02716.1 major outer membrane protein [Campylobacter sp. US33a]